MSEYYYSGDLFRRREHAMPKQIKLAIYSYRAQTQRCNYSKSKNYKNYGKKGIRVEYSLRQFVGWYLEMYQNGNFKKPVTSRIDHSKSYRFDNILLQESSENSKERCIRSPHTVGIGSKLREKKVLCYKNGEHISSGNLKDVCAIFGMSRGAISMLCRGINKKAKNGWVFKYA